MRKTTPNKILVLATHLIGDCLLATCMTHSLRKAYPNAVIDVLVTNTGGKLAFLDNKDINQVLFVELKPNFKQYLAFAKKHWRQYDLVVNDRSSDRSAIYSFITGKQRIGVLDSRHSSAKFKKLLLSEYVVESNDIEHRLVRNLRILEPLGIKKHPVVIAPVDNSANLKQQFNLPDKYIVLHTPSSNEIKQWPVTYWTELTTKLLEAGYFLVLTGGNNQRETEIVDTIIKKQIQENFINLSGKISFSQLSALIKESQGFIGPDCGPAHLASSFNIPILSIFGPTPVTMWSPWPYKKESTTSGFIDRIPVQTVDNVTIFQSERECVPCYGKRCDIKKSAYSTCLEDIKVEQVLNKIVKVIPLS